MTPRWVAHGYKGFVMQEAGLENRKNKSSMTESMVILSF
jgi:hypothetical protein